MSDSPIRHVSDTAFFAAHMRGVESARPDALFHDPLAARLAGEQGRRIAAVMSNPMSEWSIAMRTLVIDRFVQEAVAQGADAILNLGSGLDTRPWRLELPPALRWIEVDYPHVQAFKEAQLAQEPPRCRVERVSLDLADLPERRGLFAQLNEGSARIVVLTEGVVPYLSVEEAGGLAEDLHALRHVAGWIVDYISPAVVRSRRGGSTEAANAPFRFAPEDWHGFFAAHGWGQRDIRYLLDEGLERGRIPPLPPEVQALLPARGAAMPAALSEGLRKSMGYALLEPVR